MLANRANRGCRVIDFTPWRAPDCGDKWTLGAVSAWLKVAPQELLAELAEAAKVDSQHASGTHRTPAMA